MNALLKAALIPFLLIAACLVAGTYGALHNQISYTVSPEYFHGHKFHQFGIGEDLHNRVGAAIVGWRASWWMGFLIGVPVLIVGLIVPGATGYLKHCLIAFGVVAGTALLVGLGALVFAYATLTPGNVNWSGAFVGINDPVAFEHALTMHNFSYLGGFLGIFTASAYLIGVRVCWPVPVAEKPASSARVGSSSVPV